MCAFVRAGNPVTKLVLRDVLGHRKSKSRAVRDTLVLNPDPTIYDPELTHEVEEAVEREHLTVERVFAMHQEPVAWSEVVNQLHQAA
jgi:hypothetical protein